MPPIDPTPVPAVGPAFGRAFEQSFGRVLDYSSERGLGTLVATDAADRAVYDFHCTTIADGSREIADGADVVFRVAAVGPGRWEAIDVCVVAGRVTA